MGEGVLADEEDRLQVRREDSIPRLLRARVDRPVAEGPARDPDPVEHGVEPAEPADRGRHGLLGLTSLGQVGEKVGFLEVDPEDRGAGVLERAYDGAPDPAGGSRD